MKISIITVCYNAEKTIKDTLESVLKQTYINYEYLIIDGKSKDSTVEIIKEYEKKFKGKLKYISENDNGLFDAMNKGIKMATGDIIGIINSDDILAHKNVFEKVVEAIKNCDGVYSNLLMLDENLEDPYRLFKSKKASKKFGWHMPHPTLYLKKEVYEKFGNFNIKYKVSADLDFMLRLIKNNVDLKYINNYFVFMRAGGASTNGLKGYYNNFKESYKVLKNNKVKFPFLTNVKRTLGMYQQRLAIKNKKEIEKALKIENKKTKLIQINTVCNGSTGKIMGDIQRKAIEDGYDTLSIYGRRNGFKDLNCIKVGGFFSFWFHVGITTLFDKQGHGSYFKTKKIVRILKSENPDIIHLHNIHGYYLNYKVLFKYLKNEFTGKIFWTFHDCLPFTGHCPHFTLANCEKWKIECHHCPNKRRYPTSLGLDSSKNNYHEKKALFTGLKNLTIITHSNWLKYLVKQSFFKNYNIELISLGIDLSIFKYTEDTHIKEKYNIPVNKKIILGVASIWDERKGLKDFYKLAERLDDIYQVVLVGLTKKQIKRLPKNIIGIERTENQKELVKLYSLADVFVNPSKEETFSLVTLESLACKTPVIVYDNTPMIEFVNKNNGLVVEHEIGIQDIEKVLKNSKQFKFNIKEYNKIIFTKKIMNVYKEV